MSSVSKIQCIDFCVVVVLQVVNKDSLTGFGLKMFAFGLVFPSHIEMFCRFLAQMCDAFKKKCTVLFLGDFICNFWKS